MLADLPRFIGGHDWYREGAELLALQDKFVGSGGSGAMNRITSRLFALLFLSKGKRQVVIGRVKYGPKLAEPVNSGSDILKFARTETHGMGRRRDLSWQTIDLESAQLQDLLQAPVLILSSESFQFGDNVSARLKEYIDQEMSSLKLALVRDAAKPKVSNRV